MKRITIWKKEDREIKSVVLIPEYIPGRLDLSFITEDVSMFKEGFKIFKREYEPSKGI